MTSTMTDNIILSACKKGILAWQTAFNNLVRIVFVIFSVSASLNCVAQESIILAVENSWPPYANENGSGISKEIIQTAYNSVNVKVEFIVVPYARAVLMAENGEVDGVFNVTKQKSTIDILNFGEAPILQASASFYYHKNSEMNFNSVNDIPKEISVGVIIGYGYGHNYQKNKDRFVKVEVSKQEQLIKLLMSKRIDMAIMYDDVVTAKLSKMGFSQHDIKKGDVNHIIDIYVAFSKKKNTRIAMKLLDQGLVNIKKK
jgi:polar amino acid transport system substrate-binding protein